MPGTPHTSNPQEAGKILEIIGAYWTARAVSAFAELALADVLSEGPQNVRELAQKTNCHEDSLYRLLRATTEAQIVEEKEDRKFTLTSRGQYLRSDHPMGLNSFAQMHGKEWHWRSWEKLTQSVRTGVPGIELAYGQDVFSYLAGHPEDDLNFSQTMNNLTRRVAPIILESYDFSQFTCIADVGGALGELLQSILMKHSHVQGILFDLPNVIENAQKVLPMELSSRVKFVGGSFFEELPKEVDLYILKYILHDWSDEKAIQILSRFREVSKESKILIIERIIKTGSEPDPGKLVDLEMMSVTPGGRERTQKEFECLFKTAGLKISRVVPTRSPFYLIEIEAL